MGAGGGRVEIELSARVCAVGVGCAWDGKDRFAV